VRAILVLPHPHIDGALLDRIAPLGNETLKVVSNYGVGVDHIDLADCRERGIPVTHTPGVLNGATADMGFALLLATARRVVEGDAYCRGPDYVAYEHTVLQGVDVSGSTIGIVGMGRIGLEVARRARGFSMRILYHNRSRREETEAEVGAEYCADLHAMLVQSDHVVLVCPCTEQTTGLINAAALGVMKPTATLVNISRGPVVDTAALTAALREGRLGGAGLDVTDPEPLPRDHELNTLRNVVLTPHRGSAWRHRAATACDGTVRRQRVAAP
jgi:glyoxylate reductase